MRIRHVAHASLLLDTGHSRIWTHPWLAGDGGPWRCLPEPEFDPALLGGVTDLWISDARADHLHAETLAALPAAFRSRVRVWIPEAGAGSLRPTLAGLGYRHIHALGHRRITRLPGGDELLAYGTAHGTALGVRRGGQVLLDLADARPARWDCDILRRELGEPDVALVEVAQGELPLPDGAPAEARDTRLRRLVATHRVLGARRTVPLVAALVPAVGGGAPAWTCPPEAILAFFECSGERLAVLHPGDALDARAPHDSAVALELYDLAREEDRAPAIAVPRLRPPVVSGLAETLRPLWHRRRGAARRALGVGRRHAPYSSR